MPGVWEAESIQVLNATPCPASPSEYSETKKENDLKRGDRDALSPLSHSGALSHLIGFGDLTAPTPPAAGAHLSHLESLDCLLLNPL